MFKIPIELKLAYVLLMMLIMMLASEVFAGDFFCNDEASQLNGTTYSACGIGVSRNEQEARSDAFKFAKDEFYRFSVDNASWKGKEYDIEPKRNLCTKIEKNYFKCYRMVNFTLR